MAAPSTASQPNAGRPQSQHLHCSSSPSSWRVRAVRSASALRSRSISFRTASVVGAARALEPADPTAVPAAGAAAPNGDVSAGLDASAAAGEAAAGAAAARSGGGLCARPCCGCSLVLRVGGVALLPPRS